MSDKELYDRIVSGAPAADATASGHESFVADRAEMALRTASKMALRSQADVLCYLGRHFRIALPNTLDIDTDIEVRRS